MNVSVSLSRRSISAAIPAGAKSCLKNDGRVAHLATAALFCMAIAILIALAPFGTHVAFAAGKTSGNGLAGAAESEYRDLSNTGSNYIRYGEKYWTWAHNVKGDKPKKEDWCAYFAAYCAQQAGLFGTNAYPRDWGTFAGVGKTRSWFAGRGCPVWQNDGTYIPRRGDLAIQYLDGAPNHIEIVIGYSSGKVHTIGGNAGEYSEMMEHHKYLGETWKEFITPVFEKKTAASLANARTVGVVNKVYNGTDRYQTASAVKVLVGGRRLANGTDYALQYSKAAIANLYRRPTEGQGAWVYATAKGGYSGSAKTMRYRITSDTTYLLGKDTKNGWDLRLTRKPAEMKSLKRSGYTLDATMHTRASSLYPVHEYYNAKLKLHRYTFSSDVGKRLVKCGYKAQGIVAYSDPTAYAPNSGKYYAATYHNSKTCKADASRFQYCGYAWNYGSRAEMDKDMKTSFGLVRTYEMIEYPKAVVW